MPGMEPGAPPMGMGGAPPAPPADNGGEDPVELMRQALEKTRKAAILEPDDEDQAALEKLGADIAKYIGSQQAMIDSAVGAGPGVKLVRKAGGQSGPGY
jgi:hypothetical protein